MKIRSLFARAVCLMFVAMMTTGCCELFAATCDCIGCLLNGPSLPFAVSAPDVATAHPQDAPRQQPRGAVRAAMAY